MLSLNIFTCKETYITDWVTDAPECKFGISIPSNGNCPFPLAGIRTLKKNVRIGPSDLLDSIG